MRERPKPITSPGLTTSHSELRRCATCANTHGAVVQKVVTNMTFWVLLGACLVLEWRAMEDDGGVLPASITYIYSHDLSV